MLRHFLACHGEQSEANGCHIFRSR